jgi:hypothetical protein
MSFTKTLFAGAAVCALCTAPALAAPSIHLAGTGFKSPAKLIHSKTNVVHPNATNRTYTFSFALSLSQASSNEVPIQLNQYTWQDTATCVPPHDEDYANMPRRHTAAAKLSVGTVTGATSACPSSVFTFYGTVYELESTTATADSFTSALTARHYGGYNDKLNEKWAVTIGP